MKPNEKISIVMPSYNASRYISQTIDSVVAQTYKSWELLIVDDASTDDTVRIIESYLKVDPRIRLIKLEKNFGGPAGPRNKGVAESRGHWIAFIDADDLWHEEKLTRQVGVINETNVQFVSCRMQRFVSELEYKPVPSPDKKTKLRKITYLRQLLRYGTPTSSVLVKKDIMKSFPFQEGRAWRAREDMDCWLRIHKVIGYSYKLDLPLVGYRVVEGQISGDKFEMIGRTYFCFRNSRGVPSSPLGLLAVFLTGLHLFGALINRLTSKGL